MAYLKPELFVLASAPVAIQTGDGSGSKVGSFSDSASPPQNHTSNSAYEADE